MYSFILHVSLVQKHILNFISHFLESYNPLVLYVHTPFVMLRSVVYYLIYTVTCVIGYLLRFQRLGSIHGKCILTISEVPMLIFELGCKLRRQSYLNEIYLACSKNDIEWDSNLFLCSCLKYIYDTVAIILNTFFVWIYDSASSLIVSGNMPIGISNLWWSVSEVVDFCEWVRWSRACCSRQT
jgi:hypothetical protein